LNVPYGNRLTKDPTQKASQFTCFSASLNSDKKQLMLAKVERYKKVPGIKVIPAALWSQFNLCFYSSGSWEWLMLKGSIFFRHDTPKL
jgi:hypothetical protein